MLVNWQLDFVVIFFLEGEIFNELEFIREYEIISLVVDLGVGKGLGIVVNFV